MAVGNGSEGRLQTWIAAPVNRLWWVEVVLVVLVVVVVVQRASPGDQTLHHQPEHQVHSSSLTTTLGLNYDGSRT